MCCVEELRADSGTATVSEVVAHVFACMRCSSRRVDDRLGWAEPDTFESQLNHKHLEHLHSLLHLLHDRQCLCTTGSSQQSSAQPVPKTCSTCSTNSSIWGISEHILNRLHHWDLPLRQDKDLDNLLEEVQLLNLHGLEHGLDYRRLSLHKLRRERNSEGLASPQNKCNPLIRL